MDLQASIDNGKALGKKAMYFGCWHDVGHYMHEAHGRVRWMHADAPGGFPWRASLCDGGLLKNRGVADKPDGRVFWTCGGREAFWYAFYWWDRSVDTRGGSNSGFYVRGFGWLEEHDAFAYACSQFPRVAWRQKFPLVLQESREQEGSKP